MFKAQNIILLLILFLTLILNISLGQVAIPVKEVFKSISGLGASKDTWQYIIINFRLPKTIMAILVGSALSVSGLLMQTFFRNPLAGPYVLGLSSGSSLGVAFVVLGASFLPSMVSTILLSTYGIVIASCLGSFLVMVLVILVSAKIKDTATILIVGLMFSSFSSAIVSVLTYFSSAEQLQKFTFWSMGNLGNISWENLLILTLLTAFGMLLCLFCLKPLDALLLGENYAQSMGLNLKKTRYLIILATCILAGSITAFAGPIAFIGLAVPHIAKLLFKTSNHKILFVATLLTGSIIMLLCDTLSQMPMAEFTLPINAITSIIGAPIVILLILKKRV